MSRRSGAVLGLAAALVGAACHEPARQLGAGPGGTEAARAFVDALALRFGPATREPAFDALRPKLARSAMIPSGAFDDPTAWPRQGGEWRAVEFAGYRGDGGYAMGVRPFAPEPGQPGQYRGQIRLEKLASGRFEWSVREELAVGRVRPAELALVMDALLRGAEASEPPTARAEIAAAFPRASETLGRLLSLETLELAPDAGGTVRVRVGVRMTPARLKPGAPRYAAFLEKYLTPIRARATAADGLGATWWTLEGESNLWTVAFRVRGGSLVPLEGDRSRRVPDVLRVTADYATKMGRFSLAARGLVSDVSLTRAPAEKGFVARFREPPDWELPFMVESLLGGPLRYPFEGPGSEAGWSALETASGTRLVRHYRARVGENWVLRWLGGMTNRALSEFRAGAEREADQYHGECLAAIRDDLAALLARP